MPGYKSIVLSGRPVSGKSTLAQKLSSEYGWEIISIGGLLQKRFLEQHPNGGIRFEEWYRALPLDYTKEINDDVKRLFEEGNYIGESRFTFYLDPEKCLRIYLYAPLHTRAFRGLKRDEYKDLGMQELKRILLQRERDEIRVSKGAFGVDFRDPKYFDAKISSEDNTVNEEAAIIRSLMCAKR